MPTVALCVEHSHFGEHPAEATEGNVYEPIGEPASVECGWRR